MKISASKLHTLLIAGESAAIEYKRCGEGPKADTFESICAFPQVAAVKDMTLNATLNDAAHVATNDIINDTRWLQNLGRAEARPSQSADNCASPVISGGTRFRASAFAFRCNYLDAINDTINDTAHVALNVAIKLSAQEQAVVRQIQKDAAVSQAEIAERLHLSRLHVYRIVRRLKSLNVIVREGSKKTGHWKIVKEVP